MLQDGILVVTAEEMRRLDQYTIETVGIPGAVLMENAGRSVVEAFESHYEIEQSVRTAVFCGKGNNGGDGFVIARHLEARGHEAIVYLMAEISSLTGDAETMARAAANSGVTIHEIPDAESLGEIDFDPSAVDFIFDALFGTGLTSAVRGHYLGALDIINSCGKPVVAVDMPSGLSADTGEIIGPAVTADLTVTFAYPKRGLVMAPAAKLAGEVMVADISIPEIAEDESLNTVMSTEAMIRNLDLQREPDAHKGDFGHPVVVAGSVGKSGAAALTARGALCSGSGLVTVATVKSLARDIPLYSPELMTFPLREENGKLAADAVDELLEELDQFSAVAIGPGLGVEHEVGANIRKLVIASDKPVVLDADGITAFTDHRDDLGRTEVPLIITPHPGEMARLLGMSIAEVQKDRIGIARQLATELGIIVVLKGFRTVIADSTGDVYINPTGNPGMATGGSGDVLTGIIASLVGRQFTALESAVAGVFLHGMAGDLASEEKGMASLTAGDIIEQLHAAFSRVNSV